MTTRNPAASVRARLYLASVWLALCAALAHPALAQVPAAALSPVPERLVPSALPEGWHHGAFMEIFVRSWKDSDGDGMGDLRGLTQTLDTLQQLGIRGLWLMPVTRSADGDHGYATTDYRDIEPAYGTLADFDELLRRAHGSYEWPQAEGQRMAFQRRHGHEHTLVTFDYGREAAPLVLQGVQPGQRLRVLMPAGAVAGNLAVPPATTVITLGTDRALLLPAQSVQVFALEP